MPSNYEQIAKENIVRRGTDFDDIGRFLAEQLYSDPAHFIFELLQNAEDALARRLRTQPNDNAPRSVHLRLRHDRLEMQHWGAPFDEADVRGICDVLRGTKANDSTQIGRFGIGFKSVYSVTASPEIHSGDEHFRIDGYIRPSQVAPRPVHEKETLLVFPFNHAELDPKLAFEQVERRIRLLGVRTLLFLRHISEISWDVEGGASGLYLREERRWDSARSVRVLGEIDQDETDEEWLVFERNVRVSELEPATQIEIAFKIVRDESQTTPTISALPRSELVVSFPTARETHLGFLLQGPFSTTPARDNILSNDRNAFLIREAANLLAETLPRLRDMELMTVGLLEALPIQSLQFPPNDTFFPLFERVRDVLRLQDLLPTSTGKFAKSSQVKLARSTALRSLLSDDQLSLLFPGVDEPTWLTPAISQDRTPSLRLYLLRDLKVDEITPEDFANKVDHRFFEKQTDEWMSRFYRFLGTHESLWRKAFRWDRPGPLRMKRFIRLEDGSHVAPFTSQGSPAAFLPPDGGVITDMPTVRHVLLESDGVADFLRRLGLTEPDIVDEVIEKIIPKYNGSLEPLDAFPDSEYVRDLSRIVRALEVAQPPKKRRLVDALRETPFLRSRNAASGQESFRTPSTIYQASADLEHYFERNQEVWFLSAFYDTWPSLPSALGISATVRMLRRTPNQIGHIEIISERGRHERGLNGFDPAFEIDGLQHALDHITRKKAAFIWNQLLVPNGSYLKGEIESSSQQSFNRAHRRHERSTVEKLVSTYEWLPTESGQFRTPGEITIDQLPEEFARNDQLAAALGMESLLNDVARRYDVDQETLRYILENPTVLREVEESRRRAATESSVPDSASVDHASSDSTTAEPFDYGKMLNEAFARPGRVADDDWRSSDRPLSNPELRRSRVLEEITANKSLEPVREARFRTVPSSVWEDRDKSVRPFLLAEYRGKCQICSQTFMTRRGAPYFVGLYLVSRTKARWIDRPGNVLCVCPTCAAKFQHGVVESTHDILKQIADLKGPSEGGTDPTQIEFLLCGEVAQLRFTQRHLIDLQQILRASAQDSEEALNERPI